MFFCNNDISYTAEVPNQDLHPGLIFYSLMSDMLGLPVPVMEPEILRDGANCVAEIVTGDIQIMTEEYQHWACGLIGYPVAIVPRGISELLGYPQLVRATPGRDWSHSTTDTKLIISMDYL